MCPSPTQNEEVLVKDIESKFLAPTTSANARRLIKEGQARITSYNPFSIQLLKPVSNINHQKRENKMKVLNLHEFFSTPKPIYVQNISNPVGVLSLSFPKGNGTTVYFRIPANRNPVILTNLASFDSIKDNDAFKKFLMPSPSGPARLQILSQEEFDSFYQKKADEYGLDSIEEAVEEAQNRAQSFNSGVPMAPVQHNPNTPNIPTEIVPPQITVLPKVESVCLKLDPANGDRIDVREALDTFNAMELGVLDYKYIISNCFDAENKANGLIRKWASKRLEEVSPSDDAEIIQPKKVSRTKIEK